MSRIIVKGLPKGIKEERLRSIFSEKGHITDCSMKYTKGGVFRKFAFIGYKNKEEAENAVQYFNNSFIDTTKIVVERAKDFGDETKPRAWSKYSRDSSAYVKMKEKLEAKKSEKEKEDEQKLKKKKNKNFREEKLGELLGDLKDDPEFQEFLDVHKSRSQKQLWDNDLSIVKVDTKSKGDTAVKEVESDTDSDTSDSERTDVEKEESVPKNQTTPATSEKEEGKERTAKSTISDLDYLKTKISKQNKMLDDEESSDSEDDARDEEDSSGDSSDSSECDDNDKSQHDEDTKEIETTDIALHVVKMRGLPNNVKEKQVKQFFSPLEVKRIKIPKNAKGKSAFSAATVEFNSEKDTDEAMRRTKNFIGPKRILLYKIKKEKHSESTGGENARPWQEKINEENDGEEETIAESGRIFVRNLAYCCTEDDLEALFSKYGLLTEVHLPIDSLTKKVKGFAFITFMIPEHAVKAFTELDGTVFQGRMLHLLPGKEKKEDEEESKEGSSFKKQKEAERKKSASSSHNWNTLFLGANAVADVMAEKYGKSKSQILDTAAKESLGVRMALGETQIVAETREFLMESGIALDSFSQATGPRSKTVMLAKNLPSGTSAEELHDLFSKNGSVANIILPPSGVTAVIEFLEPSEARNAFRKLAYTKFKHLPLYLEWAPQNVFSEDRKVPNVSHKDKSAGAKEETMETESKEEQKEDQDQEQGDESDGEEQAEPGSVLFVKNLNFDSTEESLTKLFSKCGKLRNVTVSRKKDMKNPGKFLSMGYGFVEYKKRKSAAKAMKTLQHATLDGHQLELKVSNRDTLKRSEPSGHKKQDASKKQTGTKILVRNVPFEATTKEVRELFSVFGELKTARLPKKFSGTGTHRGFGFIDFLTKQDAKRAFNALCHSTHLYGRRLVLEWADSEESIDDLRRKTAQHYHEGPVAKRLKKSALKEDLEEGMDS